MKLAKLVSGAAVAGAGWRWWVGRRRESQTKWSPPGGARVDGVLSARVAGGGPPRVVLLHGMFNSGLYWGARYDGLSDDGGVVVPDLLGFGRSPRPKSGYTPDAHADAVAETIRAAGVEAPVLVGGHSLGSLVALRLAVRHPELVASVVAFSPPIYRDEATARRQIASTDPLARLLLVNEELCARACEFMCRHRRLSAAVVRLARPTLPAPLANDRVEHSWASYHETLSSLVLAAEAPSWVAEVQVPVRIVAGERDRAIDLGFLEELAATHPHVTLRVVDDGGHDLPLTHPDICIDELTTRSAEGSEPGADS